jgi:hypothetical protein
MSSALFAQNREKIKVAHIASSAFPARNWENNKNLVNTWLRSPSAVRNSNEFANFITGQSLSQDEMLVSFDAVSLFTIVPTELAVNIARKRLLEDDALEERTTLEVEEIVMLHPPQNQNTRSRALAATRRSKTRRNPRL